MKKMAVVACFISGALIAQPTLPTVVAGNATTTTDGNTMRVDITSNRTIVEWDTFSLTQNELTDFHQPLGSSVCLNRVTGSYSSNIDGHVHSNGGLYLINPNGILIGPHGLIDVCSFLGSTLDVSNSEFLSGGDMTFSGPSLKIFENQGEIVSDHADAVLIGFRVVNTGVVSAADTVAIAAATEAVYKPNDAERIYITTTTASPDGTGIDIQGRVSGVQNILKADGNIYSLAINIAGSVDAIGAVGKEGQVLLYSAEGAIRVEHDGAISYTAVDSGASTIKILGKEIELAHDAFISGSCERGSSDIFIGGGAGGLDPTILNATNTTMGENVRITANSTYEGNAGNVVLYADNTMDFEGTVSAMGGLVSGNGGTVEVSGKENLIFTGSVNTRAYQGETGLLIIDPNTITISGGATTLVNGCSSYSGGAGIRVLNAPVDLQTCLTSNNVLVTTTPGTGGTGDILTASTITLTSPGNNLTLNADRDINILTNFTFTDTSGSNSAALTFIAGRNFTITNGDLLTVTDAGSLTITAGNTTAGGSINIPGEIVTTDTLVHNFNALTSTSDITLTSASTGIILTGSAVSNVVNVNAGQDFLVQDLFVNPMSGSMNITTGRDFIVGRSTAASRVGVKDGDITCVVGRDLIVEGGTGGSDFAQIGFDVSTGVDSNLTFTVGRNVEVMGGTSGSSGKFGLIGHGTRVSTGGTRIGNITFNSVGGDVSVSGTAGTDHFAQIGHRRGGSSSALTVTGNIQGNGPNSVADITGDLTVQAGAGSDSYGLFGHGGEGSSALDVYTGTVGVRARNISVQGGTTFNVDTFGGIGYYANNSGGTFTIASPSSVRAIATNNMIAQANSSSVYIGARVVRTGGGLAAVSMPTIDIQAGNDLSLIGHNPHSSADESLCGLRVNAGTAESNLSVTVGRNLLMSNLSGGGNTSTFTSMQNGLGTVDGFTHTVTVSNNATILAGNGPADILAIDTLSVNVGGNLRLMASSDAQASIEGPDTTAVIVSGTLTLTGNSSPEPAYILNADGTLTVTAAQITIEEPGGVIEKTMAGGATITSTSTDIELKEGGSIEIVGALNLTAERDLHFSAMASPNSQIITSGNTTILAKRDIFLEGPLSCDITTSAGTMSVTAIEDITVNAASFISQIGTSTFVVTGGSITAQDSGKLENLGTGASTITTTTGALDLLEGGFITVGGILTASIAGDINLTALAAGSSFIRSSSSASITSGGSITLTSPMPAFIENLAGTLSVVANDSISVGGSTFITNQGTGTLTLVVDNANPIFPNAGSGAFTLATGGVVGRVGGGALRIFTAVRSQNSVSGVGNVNGTTFVPGAFDVDTPTEIWSTYFPSSAGGAPFTIFYKEPLPESVTALAIPLLPAASFELFYMFDHYYPYQAWVWRGCIFEGSDSSEPPEVDKVPFIKGGSNDGNCLTLPGTKYL